ncbi:MAG: MBOAT family protein [Verrucomicrobia bacterium]|nr:MAG: MBOAT family protein [Verrucomicrobiota bacterium]TAE89164.1 MAG: MBOAT family protein [Verrucomicrobiota bacterium]TAF27960.1 MAG: MBOAT family protein [Verrucomicrobiota bacterium]TAF42808.1 MAG: MBOAT family protein [Verrucomicrobiota bacterium]
MLFNSYTFLLVFLPVALLGWHALRRAPFQWVSGWLVLVSLVFYGVWNPSTHEPWTPRYVLLILGSCTSNYLLGQKLAQLQRSPYKRPSQQFGVPCETQSSFAKILLAAGATGNLLLLGYFKYTGFLAGIATSLTGWPGTIPPIILPLAISFFTFLQIAYLVDASRGKTPGYNFIDYLLFVTFFPHLIAGPLIHHQEMMPQFRRCRRGWHRDFPVALGIFLVGLFKKVVIADNLARIANPIFTLAATDGRPPTMAEAWVGATAYTLQLYFDFSGYSDMAIGAARLFGIRFPLNFHSPYKADSIVDFWRRWHMTLSRFLRDYLYIPLGGNRKGAPRRYANLFLTMLLGGVWHGAGWPFLIWGALHGSYLCANHAWWSLRKAMAWSAVPRPLAIGFTFLAVLVAWVFFRADNLESAFRMLQSMVGCHGIDGWPDKASRVIARAEPLKLLPALIGVWFLPNTQEIFARYRPALRVHGGPFPSFGPRRWWQWRPTPLFAAATLLLGIATGLQFDKVSEFIYFQF